MKFSIDRISIPAKSCKEKLFAPEQTSEEVAPVATPESPEQDT